MLHRPVELAALTGQVGTRTDKSRLCYKVIVSPISKVETRRFASRQAAGAALQDLVSGKADAYDAYRRLYLLWCANNAALQELRPLFRVDGIDPDSSLSVTAEFREQLRLIASKILPQFLVDTPQNPT